MKNCYFLFFIILLINGFIPSLSSNLKSNALKEETVITINQDIQGNADHKKADYQFDTTETEKNRYFKYIATSQPSSLITTFRIEFDMYSTDIARYKVVCTNVDPSEDDANIIETLKKLLIKDSACINGFVSEGRYDGIVRLDKTKTVLAMNKTELYRISGSDNRKEEIVENFNNFMQKAAPKPHFWTWENVKERFKDSKFKDSKIIGFYG